ncbi:MAG: hypothetical protein ACI8WB_006060 [Phenylobacterium sp.]|jgi:hypothetical protein
MSPNITTLPAIYQADSNRCLTTWYQANQQQIAEQLLQHGAVLFRGFKVDNVDDFEQFTDSALTDIGQYVGGATPRKQLTKSIATSTEFPDDQEIKLHNELSYEIKIPNKLLFCCLTAPQSGGQTQIADVNKVLSLIKPEIIDSFNQKQGWKLIRNFGRGFGPGIAAGFGTTDIAKIKANCQKRHIEVECVDDNIIRTSQIRAAIHHHPVSNLPLWMNHVAFWHPSSLASEQLEIFSMLFAADEFPYITLFGDGSEIPADYIDNIRSAYQQAEMKFDWQQGDVMMVDNHRVCHGRKPYTGERRIVVAMGD